MEKPKTWGFRKAQHFGNENDWENHKIEIIPELRNNLIRRWHYKLNRMKNLDVREWIDVEFKEFEEKLKRDGKNYSFDETWDAYINRYENELVSMGQGKFVEEMRNEFKKDEMEILKKREVLNPPPKKKSWFGRGKTRKRTRRNRLR